MDRRQDPRSIVTPYAFAVHPDLVGRPLATPWQRLGAILLDLVLIALLSKVVPGVLLAMGSAVLLLWLASRRPGRDALGRLFRVFVGCLGISVLSITVIVFLGVRYGDTLQEWGGQLAEQAGQEPAAPIDSVGPSRGQPGLGEVLQAVQAAAAFRGATSRAQAQEVANRLARNAVELDLSPQEVRASLLGLIPDDAPWAADSSAIVEEAIRSLLPSPSGTPTEHAPSTLAPPSAMGVPGDSSPGQAETGGVGRASAGAPAVIQDAVAHDSIQALAFSLASAEAARDAAQAEARQARRALEEAEARGPLQWLYDLLDEVGLGFGWGALYLTITHAWWKGASIGKRLFKIRVVMIDNRPPGWWVAFERAGGYAAGIATGLLGFAQVFWDPNRQAIHDKVAETVVIQDGRPPVPGPWIEEARALWGSRSPEPLERR